ncbi:hypothetical protein ACFW3Z_12465 [Nocardiopsis alba]|uniref:hypothetical protein n=1 Tax=Nocardiopsis alba TaxID=53437 RepID=UPI00366EEE7A
MLKKTLAVGALTLASAGVILSATPAAAHPGAWGSNTSGNNTYIKDFEAENEGCGNANAVLGKSLASCYNAGVIIQH